MTPDLMSRASNALQLHDEWMEQCEETNYMDTGDALNQLAMLRELVAAVLNEGDTT